MSKGQDSNRSGSEWDEGENATGRRFHPRSNENKELKERAMPRRATTIFSEVDLNGCQSRDRPRGGEKAKSPRLFVGATRPNPVTPTKFGFGKQFPKPFSLFTAMQILRADGYFRQPSLFSSSRQIGIYLSVSINTALHGEPSAPAKFNGAAFKK